MLKNKGKVLNKFVLLNILLLAIVSTNGATPPKIKGQANNAITGTVGDAVSNRKKNAKLIKRIELYLAALLSGDQEAAEKYPVAIFDAITWLGVPHNAPPGKIRDERVSVIDPDLINFMVGYEPALDPMTVHETIPRPRTDKVNEDNVYEFFINNPGYTSLLVKPNANETLITAFLNVYAAKNNIDIAGYSDDEKSNLLKTIIADTPYHFLKNTDVTAPLSQRYEAAKLLSKKPTISGMTIAEIASQHNVTNEVATIVKVSDISAPYISALESKNPTLTTFKRAMKIVELEMTLINTPGISTDAINNKISSLRSQYNVPDADYKNAFLETASSFIEAPNLTAFERAKRIYELQLILDNNNVFEKAEIDNVINKFRTTYNVTDEGYTNVAVSVTMAPFVRALQDDALTQQQKATEIPKLATALSAIPSLSETRRDEIISNFKSEYNVTDATASPAESTSTENNSSASPTPSPSESTSAENNSSASPTPSPSESTSAENNSSASPTTGDAQSATTPSQTTANGAPNESDLVASISDRHLSNFESENPTPTPLERAMNIAALEIALSNTPGISKNTINNKISRLRSQYNVPDADYKDAFSETASSFIEAPNLTALERAKRIYELQLILDNKNEFVEQRGTIIENFKSDYNVTDEEYTNAAVSVTITPFVRALQDDALTPQQKATEIAKLATALSGIPSLSKTRRDEIISNFNNEYNVTDASASPSESTSAESSSSATGDAQFGITAPQSQSESTSAESSPPSARQNRSEATAPQSINSENRTYQAAMDALEGIENGTTTVEEADAALEAAANAAEASQNSGATWTPNNGGGGRCRNIFCKFRESLRRAMAKLEKHSTQSNIGSSAQQNNDVDTTNTTNNNAGNYASEQGNSVPIFPDDCIPF